MLNPGGSRGLPRNVPHYYQADDEARAGRLRHRPPRFRYTTYNFVHTNEILPLFMAPSSGTEWIRTVSEIVRVG